jgi:hypothetical protein
MVAETRFALGRPLVATGGDRARALWLVDEARAASERLSDVEHLKEVDTWRAGAASAARRSPR